MAMQKMLAMARKAQLDGDVKQPFQSKKTNTSKKTGKFRYLQVRSFVEMTEIAPQRNMTLQHVHRVD